MDIVKDLAELLRSNVANKIQDSESILQAAKYLDAIVSAKEEIDYQIEICCSDIVKMTMEHVKDDIVERHLYQARISTNE